MLDKANRVTNQPAWLKRKPAFIMRDWKENWSSGVYLSFLVFGGSW